MGRSSIRMVLAAVVLASPNPLAAAQELTILRWSISTIDPNPTDCVAQMDAVRQSLIELDVPAARDLNVAISREFGWVVICDEQTWFHLKNSARYARGKTVSGMTDFPRHVVFLNGYGRTAARLRDTVAHEMGHMLCRCAEEEQADAIKFTLFQQARQKRRSARPVVSTMAVAGP